MVYGIIALILIDLYFKRHLFFTPKIKEKIIASRIETQYPISMNELEIVYLINQHRESLKLKPLMVNNLINLICGEHNNEMIVEGVSTHNGFVGRSNELKATLKAVSVGENVGEGYKSPNGVVDAWIRSPTHYKHIVGDYTHIGISQKSSNLNVLFYTNIFVKIY
jgi:uncharacterized protein YkwD